MKQIKTFKGKYVTYREYGAGAEIVTEGGRVLADFPSHLDAEAFLDMLDLDLWVERCSELLGCDPKPSCVAVEIENLKREVDRARKTIAELRAGMNSDSRYKVGSEGWKI